MVKSCSLFSQKAPSKMFDRVMKMPLLNITFPEVRIIGSFLYEHYTSFLGSFRFILKRKLYLYESNVLSIKV